MAHRRDISGQSSLDLYFAYTGRRDSEGRLLHGEWRGTQNWFHGLKGPMPKSEALRIQAQHGVEIVPVHLDELEPLVLEAMEKVGVDPPEELRAEFEATEDTPEITRLKAENEELRREVERLKDQIATEASGGEEEPTKEDEAEGVDNLEDTIQEETTAQETEEEETPLEDADGKPEWPGYNEAITIMKDYDFDYIEVGGGRKEANVKDAWDEFGEQFV